MTVDILAIVAVLAYFGFAAYNGQAGNAASATWKYTIEGAGFLAGGAVLWGLWQVKDWREPVAIFTAIVVLAFLLNSYQNVGSEIQQIMAVLPTLKGKFNWGSSASVSNPASPYANTPPGATGASFPNMPTGASYGQSLPGSDQGLYGVLTGLTTGYLPSGLPTYSTLNDLNAQALSNISGGAAGL